MDSGKRSESRGTHKDTSWMLIAASILLFFSGYTLVPMVLGVSAEGVAVSMVCFGLGLLPFFLIK